MVVRHDVHEIEPLQRRVGDAIAEPRSVCRGEELALGLQLGAHGVDEGTVVGVDGVALDVDVEPIEVVGVEEGVELLHETLHAARRQEGGDSLGAAARTADRDEHPHALGVRSVDDPRHGAVGARAQRGIVSAGGVREGEIDVGDLRIVELRSPRVEAAVRGQVRDDAARKGLARVDEGNARSAGAAGSQRSAPSCGGHLDTRSCQRAGARAASGIRDGVSAGTRATNHPPSDEQRPQLPSEAIHPALLGKPWTSAPPTAEQEW